MNHAKDLQLKHIVHSYSGSDQQTIKDLHLSIQQGETIAILGPSGCGKSTLLRVIAGLEPHQGTVTFEGITLTAKKHPPEKRNFGMVFQDSALFPHLNVEQNLKFGLKKCSTKEADQKIFQLTSILKIQPYLNRYPHQLSGGQQQRVAIARAMVRRPELILLDEPFSSLDAQLRLTLVDEIKTVLKGTTTILVTHDQSEAFRMANKIIVMNEGEIMQIGTPQELYDHPINLFVAKFIGQGCLDSKGMFIRPEWLSLNHDGDINVEIEDISDHGHAYFHQLKMDSGITLPWYHNKPLGKNKKITMSLSRNPIDFSSNESPS